MRFKEIIKRLTGISSPIFGVSWNPENTSSDVAKRVITFLEDRRVLYNPSEMEVPSHCVQSVFKIRDFLTEQIPQSTESELTDSLKAMRAACRKFLDKAGSEDDVASGNDKNNSESWQFSRAIGELRAVFGIHVVKIAGMYGLDVEDDLASIFPDVEENESEI